MEDICPIQGEIAQEEARGPPGPLPKFSVRTRSPSEALLVPLRRICERAVTSKEIMRITLSSFRKIKAVN